MATQDPAALEERIPPLAAARFGWPLPPLAGADGADEDAADDAAGDDAAAAGESAAGADGDDKPDIDWKSHSRKHERAAKQARKEADDLKARLDKLEADSKSDHEKELDQARREAADAARSEVTASVREKLLKAEIRAHAAGRFADVEDAIKLVELDEDDIFNDEGEVHTDALKTALDQLLERKPHLAAQSGKVTGDADAGKGKGVKDLESMSVDEHLARIRKTAA